MAADLSPLRVLPDGAGLAVHGTVTAVELSRGLAKDRIRESVSMRKSIGLTFPTASVVILVPVECEDWARTHRDHCRRTATDLEFSRRRMVGPRRLRGGIEKTEVDG